MCLRIGIAHLALRFTDRRHALSPSRSSQVFPQLKACKFTCGQCGFVLGPYTMGDEEIKMKGVKCFSCQGTGPYTVRSAG